MAKNDNVDLWAQDEVHFQQHGSRCKMWIPPEVKKPIVLHAPTRKKVGYFGAVRLRDGKLICTREEDKFNGDTFFQFMRNLKARASHTKRRIVVIVDNARYHHAKLHKEWRAENKKQFELLFLPPYSPDLNPVERVWKLTRRLCVHNHYFPDIRAVSELLDNQFHTWSKPNESLRKLCAII